MKIILITIILVGLYSCKSEKEKYYNTTIQDDVSVRLRIQLLKKLSSSRSTPIFPAYDEIKEEFIDTKFYEKEIYKTTYENWREWKKLGKPNPPPDSYDDYRMFSDGIFDFENDTIKNNEGFYFRGYVDAKNMFGEIVRYYYIYTAYSGRDGYNLMSITGFLERYEIEYGIKKGF